MYDANELAIYIHWPFCKSKCPYCDFFKQINPKVNQREIIDEYIVSLQRYKNIVPQRKIKSIFFGGGTPSLMEPRYVAQIIDEISSLWNVKNDCEISLEANPNSHHKTIFRDLHNAGINRLSLGVQALNEADLRFLGRTHSLEQARFCIEEIVKEFNNHSVDLIYARPEQKIAQWQNELTEICGYGLKHISLYQLTIEEGTVFAKKGIKALNEEEATQLYDFTRDFLGTYGYEHYEISNFAYSGFQSKHNLTYWQGGDYIGIGQSAHGRLHLNGKHIATEYPFAEEELSAQQRAQELIIMGLRLISGINKADFKAICGLDFDVFVNKENLQQLVEAQLVENNTEFIKTTKHGILLTDEIIRQLCF